MKNVIRSSKTVASDASKLLKDKKSSRRTKSVAGSTLSNRRK